MISGDTKYLAAFYAEMNSAQFALIKREDLTEAARPYYDAEMAKRHPGWIFQGTEPVPEDRPQALTQPQEEIKRRVKIQKIKWFALAVFCFAAEILAGANGYSALRIYFMGLSCILFAMAASVPKCSSYATGYAVLWLRRFHRRQRQKDLLRGLNNACQFVGVPITVQDSSFHFSLGFATGRLERFLWCFLGIFLVAGLVPVTESDLDIMGLVYGAVLGLAFATAYWWAYVRLRRTRPLEQMARLLQRVRDGKVRSDGVVILHIQDGFWREVVEMAMRQADVVVIDVADPSENVIWELQTALRVRSPETILLTCPQADNSPPVFPVDVQSVLQSSVGTAVGQLPVFYYPMGRVPIWGRLPESHWSNKLRTVLTQCISFAPPHGVPNPLGLLK